MRTAKRALAVVCLLAFSLVAFVVPAGAADNTFPSQPLPATGSLTSSNYTSNGLNLFSYNGGDYYFSVNSAAPDSTVVFAWGDAYQVGVVSTTSPAVFYRSSNGANGDTGLNSVDPDDSSIHYRQIIGNLSISGYTGILPYFSSWEAGYAAAKAFLLHAVTADPQTYRFTIPAGYVAYISLEDPDQEIDISATMFNNSALIGTNGSYWPSNATIRDGASYPTAGTQFPISGAQTIRWFKDAGGSTNLLGQTKAARSTFHASNNLVEIYNPYHTGSTVGDSTEAATSWLAGDPNPNLVVTVTGLSPNGVRMYSLSDRLDVSSDAPSFIVSGSNDDFDDYIESSNQPPENPDPTNPQPVISWLTKDGDPTPAPSPGGENEPIQSASIADILSNFLSRFTSLFTEGFDAIRNLSQNAQQFVSRLSSLYAWLPPQILGVLTSAIILAIIVGVLKVFL